MVTEFLKLQGAVRESHAGPITEGLLGHTHICAYTLSNVNLQYSVKNHGVKQVSLSDTGSPNMWIDRIKRLG